MTQTTDGSTKFPTIVNFLLTKTALWPKTSAASPEYYRLLPG